MPSLHDGALAYYERERFPVGYADYGKNQYSLSRVKHRLFWDKTQERWRAFCGAVKSSCMKEWDRSTDYAVDCQKCLKAMKKLWWMEEINDDLILVVPLHDETSHEITGDCICGPTVEIIVREGRPDAHMHTHHALDGRK